MYAPAGVAEGRGWRRAFHAAGILTLGFVGAPAVIGQLSLSAHAVVPEIFIGLAALAGGALALLFARLHIEA
jgi:hypothetical protein